MWERIADLLLQRVGGRRISAVGRPRFWGHCSRSSYVAPKSRPSSSTYLAAGRRAENHSVIRSRHGRSQARACWRWANFLAAASPSNKPVLRINLDESSIKMHTDVQPGLVAEASPKRRRRMLSEGKGPDLQTRRSAATLIAFICDDVEVQQRLPQIFVVNEHMMNATDFSDIAARCHGRLLMIRRSSAWVNASFMVEVVRVLATCIQSELKEKHVILHMDTCPAHTHRDVLAACAAAGMCVHFVPASTTAWLQPLDVLVFAKMKRWALQQIERRRLESTSGLLSRSQVLDVYREAVESVICQQDWARAFDLCGLRGQAGLSKRLMERLGFAQPPLVDERLPSLADLVATFPTGRNIPIDDLFEPLVNASAPAPAVLRLPRSARLPPCAVLE